MRRALIASAALHALAGLALWAGLAPHGRPLPDATVVTVEVVSEAPPAEPEPPRPEPAETAPLPERDAAAPPEPPAMPAEPQPKPKPEPVAPTTAETPEPASDSPAPQAPAETPKPAPVAVAVAEPAPPPPPPSPKPEPAPAPPAPKPEPAPPPAKAEPAPAKPKPVAAPPPAPKPAPRPQPEPQLAQGAAPEAVPRPQPRPAPPPAQSAQPAEPRAAQAPERADVTKADPLEALLRSVEEVAERKQADERRQGRGRAEAADGTSAAGTGPPSQALLQGLQRMVEDQIYRCWIVPVGASNLDGIQVVLRFRLARDGSLLGMEIGDRERFQRDPVFRAVAESAIRAVHQCAPLSLPADQYAYWRDIEMNFDPARALGG